MGFFMAIPVGPNGVLCIRRTLSAGWFAGLVTGLGVGVVDSIFGAIAGSGSTLIKTELHKWEQPIRFFGGLVLLGFAIYIFRSKPPESKSHKADEANDAGGLIKYFLSGFVLAISNPTVIFTFAAVYITLGLAAQVSGSYLHLLYFVGGLGMGSTLWFAILCGITAKLADKFSDQVLKRINQLCALLIVIFACYTLGAWAVKALASRTF
jgi:threonine/homoserine/homoserine lactone efflux protein